MKKTQSFIMACALSVFAVGASAGDKSWTGKIGDSTCGAKHNIAAEHAGAKMSDRDCAMACVKNGGKYIFVVGSKVYNIDNQSFAGLEEHAGHTVKLTGAMAGDTITVSKIEMKGDKPSTSSE
jgi:hypothetical protein